MLAMGMWLAWSTLQDEMMMAGMTQVMSSTAVHNGLETWVVTPA